MSKAGRPVVVEDPTSPTPELYHMPPCSIISFLKHGFQTLSAQEMAKVLALFHSSKDSLSLCA